MCISMQIKFIEKTSPTIQCNCNEIHEKRQEYHNCIVYIANNDTVIIDVSKIVEIVDGDDAMEWSKRIKNLHLDFYGLLMETVNYDKLVWTLI